MTHKKGTVLFAAEHHGGDDRQAMIEEAKAYIKAQGHTKETVRMAERDGMIVVVAK